MRLAFTSTTVAALALMLAVQPSFAGPVSQSSAQHGIIIVGGSPKPKPASKSIIIVGGSPQQKTSAKGIIIVGGSPQAKMRHSKTHLTPRSKRTVRHVAPQ